MRLETPAAKLSLHQTFTWCADTACSSSLVGLHFARSAIMDGQAGNAFACGVHMQCTPTSTLYVAAASMLSLSGR